MGKDGELRMTYSGLLLKDGEKMVRVCFERGKNDYAEGIVPRGAIVKSSGFTKEEIEQLTVYIQDNATDILKKAKEVNFLNDWLGRSKNEKNRMLGYTYIFLLINCFKESK